MKIAAYTFLLFFFMIVCSCSSDEEYVAKAKTLDSLSGALNTMLLSVNKIDTAVLDRALTRYNNYRQFIDQNGTDTLSRSEADHLRKFVESGQNLTAVKINRRVILERGSLVNSQLSSLTADIKKRAIKRDQLHTLNRQEIEQTDKLISQGYNQQKIFFSAVEELKNTIPSVEKIIRRKNSGELPVVITSDQPL